jgi:hypothetical protein
MYSIGDWGGNRDSWYGLNSKDWSVPRLATLDKLPWLYCVKLDWNEDVDWDSSSLVEGAVLKVLWRTEGNHMKSVRIVGILAAIREQVRPDWRHVAVVYASLCYTGM